MLTPGSRIGPYEVAGQIGEGGMGVVYRAAAAILLVATLLAQSPTLAAYVNRYRAQKVTETHAVEFIPYDWTVNRQPR